ncbi:MAG: hypothetical protein ABIY55_36000 [Kofleriaceae bacterium]
MQRLWLAVSLMITACGASGASRPPSTTAGTPDPSAENAPTEGDVSCADEVRTGTHLEKKICRSQNEKDQDKRAVEDMYLHPPSRGGAQ